MSRSDDDEGFDYLLALVVAACRPIAGAKALSA